MAWNFCNAIVPPLILPLSLSLSLATRQKPREPRKLNSVSRLTFTANERIFFFSLSLSPSIPYFYTKRNKRAIRGSFDSSIILTSPFRALDPPPLPPPRVTDRRSIPSWRTNRRFGTTFEILKNESAYAHPRNASVEGWSVTLAGFAVLKIPFATPFSAFVAANSGGGGGGGGGILGSNCSLDMVPGEWKISCWWPRENRVALVAWKKTVVQFGR